MMRVGSIKEKKKVFIKAVENIKLNMKKGNERQIAKLKFKILDVRVVKNGSEIYIDLTNAKERGNVVKLKLSPPPQKKKIC